MNSNASRKIFIGYRRDDTGDMSGRLCDRLRDRFGHDAVFKDVDDLPAGVRFDDHIRTLLPQCHVFLALIGPNWTEARDADGRRRLDDPQDWVRLEIELALAQSALRVIPVLTNNAELPAAHQLPHSLQGLRALQSAVVRRDPDFHRDVDRLIEAMEATGLARSAKGAPTYFWSNDDFVPNEPRVEAPTSIATLVSNIHRQAMAAYDRAIAASRDAEAAASSARLAAQSATASSNVCRRIEYEGRVYAGQVKGGFFAGYTAQGFGVISDAATSAPMQTGQFEDGDLQVGVVRYGDAEVRMSRRSDGPFGYSDFRVLETEFRVVGECERHSGVPHGWAVVFQGQEGVSGIVAGNFGDTFMEEFERGARGEDNNDSRVMRDGWFVFLDEGLEIVGACEFKNYDAVRSVARLA